MLEEFYDLGYILCLRIALFGLFQLPPPVHRKGESEDSSRTSFLTFGSFIYVRLSNNARVFRSLNEGGRLSKNAQNKALRASFCTFENEHKTLRSDIRLEAGNVFAFSEVGKRSLHFEIRSHQLPSFGTHRIKSAIVELD